MVGSAHDRVHFGLPNFTITAMALKSTIYKAELQIADMDRHYYANHTLTLAMHPSETEERLMVRLLAFVLNADEALSFGRGLSAEDEPDLWRKDLTGAIQTWIEVGQPDDRSLLKACGRSEQVLVYSYGTTAPIWWGQMGSRLERARNLKVFSLPPATTQAMAALAKRSMQWQCTMQDGQLWMNDGDQSVQIDLTTLKGE